MHKPAKPAPRFHAQLTLHPTSITVVLTAPEAPAPVTADLLRRYQATVAAAAYRFAAAITELNADEGASLALELEPHEGIVTVDAGDDQDVVVLQCLVDDACQRLRLRTDWQRG